MLLLQRISLVFDSSECKKSELEVLSQELYCDGTFAQFRGDRKWNNNSAACTPREVERVHAIDASSAVHSGSAPRHTTINCGAAIVYLNCSHTPQDKNFLASFSSHRTAQYFFKNPSNDF